MIARLTFLAIAAFWLAMNFLLWRAEFGSHGGDTPVPIKLVWRKILTAPDASSLSVFQNHQRMGYCEFSTTVARQMATVDEDNPPLEGLVAKAGYQIHLSGNIALNDFTNRIKFAGRASFSPVNRWRELNLKISSRAALLEIHSLATNQSVHVKISNDGGLIERDLSAGDLQNPNVLLRIFLGDFAGNYLAGMDLPVPSPADAAQTIHWDSRRTRLKIGTETVPVYHLETTLLGNIVSADVSTLGEILQIKLPGNLTARIDEISRRP